MRRLLVQALDGLIEELQARGVLVVDHLMRGLDTEEIAILADGAQLVLPEEIETLYQWHDGTTGSWPERTLFPSADFISLTEALRYRDQWMELLGPNSAHEPIWRPDWLPLFADDDAFRCGWIADCGGTNSVGTPCFYGCVEDGWRSLAVLRFASLKELIGVVRRRWEAGVYYLNEEHDPTEQRLGRLA